MLNKLYNIFKSIFKRKEKEPEIHPDVKKHLEVMNRIRVNEVHSPTHIARDMVQKGSIHTETHLCPVCNLYRGTVANIQSHIVNNHGMSPEEANLFIQEIQTTI